jgi:uncharacterized protein (TIGR02466 family)
MKSAEIYSLFSTPIYYCDDTNYRLSQSERSHVNSLALSLNTNDTSLSLSNDVYVLKNLAMKNIEKLCQKHLDYYTKEVLRIKQDFYITNSWITVKNKGGHHNRHNHQNCIFSGVLYLNANDSQSITFHGKSRFLDYFNFDYLYDDYNIYNCKSWSFSVKTGTIIIFPSHVDHSVEENKSDDSRIVLGFNSFVKGSFGMEDSSLYCSQLIL